MVMGPIEKMLKQSFPRLKSTKYKITSPCDPSYNCIAWAAEDTSVWWEPDPMGNYYWPMGIPREYSLEAYRAVYELIGYNEVSGEELEPEFQKVAVYAIGNKPTHASRQLDSGNWSSKLGKNVDIEHTLQGVVGHNYGDVKVILKKLK